MAATWRPWRSTGRAPILAEPGAGPELVTTQLSDKAPYQNGVQCCGGEVTVLLEPLAVLPAVAIFGIGHVGLELARILARHELNPCAGRLPLRPAVRRAAGAAGRTPPRRIHTHHVPVLPELILGELPPGAHVLVMTHDHAEDAALVDARRFAPRTWDPSD